MGGGRGGGRGFGERPEVVTGEEEEEVQEPAVKDGDISNMQHAQHELLRSELGQARTSVDQFSQGIVVCLVCFPVSSIYDQLPEARTAIDQEEQVSQREKKEPDHKGVYTSSSFEGPCSGGGR